MQVLRYAHQLCYTWFVVRKSQTRKITDYETRFRCAGGVGILREEVWIDAKDEVVQYNLALILPHLFLQDNGRVLGYDNAHGYHERHFHGTSTKISFPGYPALSRRFYREAEAMRNRYEDESDD